jgi:hypothetical protein
MNIVNTSALEDDDTSFLDGRRGSVRLATHPVGEEVHRVDGRQLDLQTLLLAKQEFQDHMRSILLRGVKEGLVSQHETAMSQSPSYAAEIDTYQRVLRQTKLWNQDIISRETNRVLGDNKNLFPNLLAALYISQVKLMASVRVTKGPCTVQINVPSSESFLHRVYIECARILFQNPLLIYVGKNMSPSKLCERNVNLDRVVADGITEAVRYMLPVKDIMSEYLNSTMLQSSVLSMGDDFEAYMKSPYESRFVEHTPTIPSVDPFHPSMYQSLPVVSQFNPPPPLPPPPPPPAPAPPPPPPTTLPSIPGMPSWNPASGFDDPDTKVVSRDDYTKFDARAPNPLVSRFEDRSDDGSGSEIPDSDSESDIASSRDFEEDS